MRDPELVARAQRAAARLESARERWRALRGLAETPAQLVIGNMGYPLIGSVGHGAADRGVGSA